MPIIKIQKKEHEFITIDKYPIFTDSRLSFKAKGILTFLSGYPLEIEISITDLIKQSTDKETRIRSGLNELKKYGYIKEVPHVR